MNKHFEELPEHLKEVLQKSRLDSVNSILLCSESKASKLLDLSKEEFEEIKLAAAKSTSKYGFVSALHAHTTFPVMTQHLSVGCQILDKFLQGGIVLRGITEVTGASGTGKTQFCLQLSLNVQYPNTHGGLNAGAIYICTEKTFPSRRLQELLNTFSPTFQKPYMHKPNIAFGDNIFIEHIPDVDSLKNCITNSLPHLLVQKKIGLIIIDSIAGVFRADYERKDLVQRARDLQIIGRLLHKLSHKFSLAVVCVNQVSCAINEGDEETQLVAALSLAWANLVTTRMQLSRRNECVSNFLESSNSSPVRKMEIVFSPRLPNNSCQFKISSCGIVGIQ